MDWNKKIYPSEMLRVIYGPFEPFMSHLRSIIGSIFDIKWKGDHEVKYDDYLTDEDIEFIEEFKRESYNMFGRTLHPNIDELPSRQRIIIKKC